VAPVASQAGWMDGKALDFVSVFSVFRISPTVFCYWNFYTDNSNETQ